MSLDRKPIVAVEVVGVLAARTFGVGWEFNPAEWKALEGSKAFLEALHAKGCIILIHTILVNPDLDVDEQVAKIKGWLRAKRLPWDLFHTEVGKPYADVYYSGGNDEVLTWISTRT